MITKPDLLATTLSQHGYSKTKQRQIVFEQLLDQEPLTMHELIARVSGQVDRASVYRTIETFEKIGIVHRLNIGWKYKIELSDKFVEHHHHLTCLRCHKIIPINEKELEMFMDKIVNQHDFQATEHQIEIQGYCSTCTRLKSQSNRL